MTLVWLIPKNLSLCKIDRFANEKKNILAFIWSQEKRDKIRTNWVGNLNLKILTKGQTFLLN